MGEVGKLFEVGEYYVPEMLVAARAMKSGLAVIQPLLLDSGVEPVGRVVIGSVEGDLHDIGKSLVAMMLEGAGFEVNDLGVDVSPQGFIAAMKDAPDIVALSALLTTTMSSMEAAIKAIHEAGLRGQVKIIVGGAPVTAEFASHIGADGYAPDAGQAAALARTLVS
jgi:5-methyltetrahydrofolate--homocysteine methyltransferase